VDLEKDAPDKVENEMNENRRITRRQKKQGDKTDSRKCQR
jgi:hypothetical protein